MSRGFYNGVSSMATYGRRLDNVAHNLANLSTTGFKRTTTAMRSFSVPGAGDGGQQVRVVARRDWTQGSLIRTDNTFDLALDGEGFFSVESPQGEVYTRSGAFRVDAGGVLQTQEGHPVVWDGAAGTIDPAGDPVTVDARGNVRQGNSEVGTLRLVDFAAKDRLVQDERGYFHRPPFVREATFTAEVHQGALEASNTTGFEEMVEMIQLQRSFQSMTQLLGSLREGYDRLTQLR